MPLCFVWLRQEGPWQAPKLVPQKIEEDILDYMLSSPNSQAHPKVVKRHRLSEDEQNLSLDLLSEKFPKPIEESSK